ncbi:ATP-binding protein [Paenibacillus polymyxa]|uniref:ATP-binding protein n=3 Tax=Paenibacillus polymyxa TaxID=1406 RepID=UPI001580E583|nr:ATP-binding protein [Paenibacillus polymyxa]MBY0024515.1 ATP-binding protein [Paenibacillus polymyxa]MBY0058643.1 ATP-binding protein [Paenibacillus polymyxa]MBY0071229.1 ATP-binding protein [Paenibacillus polymyxa]MBY0083492.1 ATP-binding protein [Paenibacillus polymyxa]MBZ6441682.1 ATP-binding protein [Paenibacillus polymyxa]
MADRIEKLRAMTKRRMSENSATKNSQDSYKCQHCKDTGDIWVDTWTLRECTYCNVKKIEDIQRKVKAAQITDEFKNKTFGSFDVSDRPDAIKEAKRIAQAYAIAFEEIRGNKKNSIALMGNPGSGKTHLLAAIANNLLSKGVEVFYFPWVEGVKELTNASFEQKQEIIHRMQQCEVLFLDDLFKGRDKPTEFQFETAWAVLNYRYLNNKPILASTERSISDLLDIDEAMGSRIAEVTKDYRAVINGSREDMNYRLQ